MTDPSMQIVITGKADVDRAAKKSEKRLAEIPKSASGAVSRAMDDADRRVSRAHRSMLGSFNRIGRASARALGGNGITRSSGVLTRLSAISTASESASVGLGDAAAAGGLFEATLGALATGAALAGGIIVGVGVATDKLVGSWAKGVAGAGQLADTIGVATRALQEFQGAGERLGVDKSTSGGALASISQTLSDARYGRNTTALAILGKMGVGLRTKSDGTVDVEGMLPAIATALRAQNSSGRRTAAGALGIPLAALPMFTQGGKALAADMADVGQYGNVAAPGEVERARAWRRRRVMLGQMAERAADRAGAWGADNTQGALDAGLSFGRSTLDASGQNIARGADQFARSVVNEFRPAAEALAGAVGGASGGSLADRIEHLGERSRQNQTSPKGAFGVMQLMPQTAREAAAWARVKYDDYRAHHDAAYNRFLGNAYIDKLQHRLRTTDPAVIGSAYNAGPGVVQDWLDGSNKSRKNPAHRQLPDPRAGASDSDFIAGIPGGGFKETRDYASRVAAGAAGMDIRHDIHIHDHRTTVDTKIKHRAGRISLANDHVDSGNVTIWTAAGGRDPRY